VMKNIEVLMKPLIENKTIHKFWRGSIKTLERCVEKTETDYMVDNIPFPQSSKIIDTIQCSLSFQTLSHLFSTVDHFFPTYQSK
jgi:hypothetical protein